MKIKIHNITTNHYKNHILYPLYIFFNYQKEN